MTSNSTSSEAGIRLSLFVKFAQALLPLIKTWVAQKDPPYMLKQKRQFADDGWSNSFTYDVPLSFRLLLNNHNNDIWELESAIAFVERGLSDHVLQLDSPQQYKADDLKLPIARQNLLGELISPIIAVIEDYSTIQLTETQLAEGYARYEATWHKLEFERKLIIPIQNFSTPSGPLKLGSSLLLSAFTPDEKTGLYAQIARQSGLPHYINELEFSSSKFKLSASYMRDRNAAAPYQDHQYKSEVERVITALRLLKEGTIGVQVMFAVDALQQTHSPFSNHKVAPNNTKPYELLDEDIAKIELLLDSLDSKVEKSLAVALRRFNQSYTREFLEDRLIDLTIALENCLLYGIRDELKYRLAVRGAALLKSSHIPAQTYLLLQIIYDVRSAIVHEGIDLQHIKDIEQRCKKLDPAIAPNELPQRCAEIVRSILKALMSKIHNGAALGNIVSDLDKDILDSLSN